MRRFVASFAALAAILALTAGSALAVPIPGTLDQQQTNAPDGGYQSSNYYQAQTFTAGITGTLDAVTVQIGFNTPEVVAPAVAGDFTVAIWATSGGVPSGASALTSETITGNAVGTVAVVFSSPISIAAGTQYAIVLVADPARGISWLGQCGTDSYADGQALIYDVLNFPAWRTIPAWALLADSDDCILDYAFGTYVSPALTSPTPTPSPTPSPTPTPTTSPSPTVAPSPTPTVAPTLATTLPPTATSGDTPRDSSDPTVFLVVAGLAAAAVLASLRRSGFARR